MGPLAREPWSSVWGPWAPWLPVRGPVSPIACRLGAQAPWLLIRGPWGSLVVS